MDVYTFVVETFQIHDTRAFHEDSLKLGYTAHVNGDLVAEQIVDLGEHDNGEYSTIDFVSSDEGPGLTRVVINDPTANVAFIFQLLNAGNVSAQELNGRVVATADQLAGMTAGLAGAGALAFPAGLALELFANVYAWLTDDCDAPVAVDQISGPRYVLDARTDNPAASVRVHKNYTGGDPAPTGCGVSHYELTWFLEHERMWLPVIDGGERLASETAVAAAEHNGAVHAFGVVGNSVSHARTFTGATWSIDAFGPLDLAPLPVSATSFNDRLHVFGVHADGSITSFAYTVDGGAWTLHVAGPGPLQTNEAIATAVFRHRLHLLARDSASGQLRMSSTSDLAVWDPWTTVPSPTAAHISAIAATTLEGKLFVFGVFKTGKRPDVVIMGNSTSDGTTWSGWDTIEAGAIPEGTPADTTPVDVAAGSFDGRVYIVSRWRSTAIGFTVGYVAVNFSEDGANWSGWRPRDFGASASAGVAAVGNHLYILAPQNDANVSDTTHVWAY
jgi:hypothetical protein